MKRPNRKRGLPAAELGLLVVSLAGLALAAAGAAGCASPASGSVSSIVASSYATGGSQEKVTYYVADIRLSTGTNLDGGGSSTLYYQGEVVNQPSNKKGERAVTDILYVK